MNYFKELKRNWIRKLAKMKVCFDLIRHLDRVHCSFLSENQSNLEYLYLHIQWLFIKLIIDFLPLIHNYSNTSSLPVPLYVFHNRFNFDALCCESCKAFFRRNGGKLDVCFRWTLHNRSLHVSKPQFSSCIFHLNGFHGIACHLRLPSKALLLFCLLFNHGLIS